MSKRLTISAVNKALAAAGHKAELVKGKGYYWFSGDEAADWYTANVDVYRLNHMPEASQWVRKYEQLKADHARRRGEDVPAVIEIGDKP